MSTTTSTGSETQNIFAPIIHRVGQPALREGALPILSCLAAFLRWNGIHIGYDDLQDIAPVASKVLPTSIVSFLCRRIGIEAETVTDALVSKPLLPVLMQEKSGFALLLLEQYGSLFIAVAPATSPAIRIVRLPTPCSSRNYYSLKLAPKAGPAFVKKYRPARLFLIPWMQQYMGEYSKKSVQQVNAAFAALSKRQQSPGKITELTVDALLTSHRQICPTIPEYYGVFRTINLRRTTVFVDHKAINSALTHLFFKINSLESQRTNKDNSIYICSRFLVDFLTIHPFIDGNRRVAVMLISYFINKRGYGINWTRISRSQLYYATRLACKGHFSYLEGLLTVAIEDPV
jgi:fido (protein-threonine AMPylation protein)